MIDVGDVVVTKLCVHLAQVSQTGSCACPCDLELELGGGFLCVCEPAFRGPIPLGVLSVCGVFGEPNKVCHDELEPGRRRGVVCVWIV